MHTVLLHHHLDEIKEIFTFFLSEYSMRVVECNDAQELLRLARVVAPCAIVVDALHPFRDGFEILASLQKHSRPAPSIFYTSITPCGNTYRNAIDGFLVRPKTPRMSSAALRALHNCIPSCGRRTKVLLAESDVALMRSLRQSLARRDVEIIDAYDGLEAIEYAFQRQPDCALIDMRLPVVDGREAIKTIAQSPLREKMRVTALTRHAPLSSARDITSLLAHSAEGLTKRPLHKTIPMQELFSTLCEVLHGQ